jgi:hypothetical protein
MLPTSRWLVGGRWRTRAAGSGCGPRRPRCGHGSRLQRGVAAPAAWLPSSGWVRDHGHTTTEMAARIAAAVQQRLTVVLQVAEQTLETRVSRATHSVF